MSGLGTDVLALACILGGATVGGAATRALVDGHGAHTRVACATMAIHTSPRVVVSMDGGKRTVVVAPKIRIRGSHGMHGSHGCMAFVVDGGRHVRVTADEMRARMEEARARMEEARARVEEARARAEAVRADDGSDLGAQIQAQVQEQLHEQMKHLDEQMAKLDSGAGR